MNLQNLLISDETSASQQVKSYKKRVLYPSGSVLIAIVLIEAAQGTGYDIQRDFTNLNLNHPSFDHFQEVS